MKLNPRQRRLILGSLLAATVGAGLWLDDEAPDTTAPSQERHAPKPVSGSPGSEAGATAGASSLAKAETWEMAEDSEADEDGDKDKDDGETLIDPFRPTSWYVAPPPPPPEKPKAPSLPFKFLGRLVEDGGVRVFLSDQDRHLIVRLGEIINGNYKIEKISDGQVVFVYLPLKERQILTIGSE